MGAVRFNRSDTVCDTCIRLFSRVGGSRFGSLCEDVLILPGEILEEVIIYNQGDEVRKMIRFHDVILLFVKTVGHDNLVGIFLSINRVLLQSDVDFTE